jgi:hypothetical protein
MTSVFLAAVLCAQTVPADAATGPRVAIVPTVNLSGESWNDLMTRQNERINNYLTTEFTKRNFRLVDADDLADAAREMDVDWRDEENHRRAVLLDLARKVEADYIYFNVVTFTDQKTHDRDNYTDREGRTDVKIWFLETKTERAIYSARTFVGRSGGMRVTLRPSDRQLQAGVNAVRDAIQPFFKEFAARQVEGQDR